MHSVGLSSFVKMFPTPTAKDGKSGDCPSERRRNTPSLVSAVKMFPTPGATLETAVGSGQLNPDWVELLMGWPKGWTALDAATFDMGAWHGLQESECPWPPVDWESGVPRVSCGVKNRTQRLKCIGNGQVPVCAAAAFRVLWDVMEGVSHEQS